MLRPQLRVAPYVELVRSTTATASRLRYPRSQGSVPMIAECAPSFRIHVSLLFPFPSPSALTSRPD